MQKRFSPAPASWMAALTVAVLAAGAVTGPATAQQQVGGYAMTPERRTMQRCVSSVLARLAREKKSDKEVGPAVVQQCDSQLRASLSAAIKSGEAPCDSVDACMGMARDRASQAAIQEFRLQAHR